jgi:hypothetical protein
MGYGAMQLAGPRVLGLPEDVPNAITVLRTAVDLGIRFFDTANAYGPRIVNQLIGEALSPYPDDIVIGNKVGAWRSPDGDWTTDHRPEFLRSQVEDALRDLRADVSCLTNPIYSQDRQHLLVPEGTFILGDVQKVAGLGQKRLAVTFHRMLMPDGYSVDLDQFHGLDQAGSTGLKDKVNNHYVEIFGASIALGVIAGAAEATNNNAGYNQSGTEAYKSGIASSLSQSSANVLDRFINIPPTITIREGHRIKVYITQDMLLPAYENHDMPGVM